MNGGCKRCKERNIPCDLDPNHPPHGTDGAMPPSSLYPPGFYQPPGHAQDVATSASMSHPPQSFHPHAQYGHSDSFNPRVALPTSSQYPPPDVGQSSNFFSNPRQPPSVPRRPPNYPDRPSPPYQMTPFQPVATPPFRSEYGMPYLHHGRSNSGQGFSQPTPPGTFDDMGSHPLTREVRSYPVPSPGRSSSTHPYPPYSSHATSQQGHYGAPVSAAVPTYGHGGSTGDAFSGNFSSNSNSYS